MHFLIIGTVTLFYIGGEAQDSITSGRHRGLVWAGASAALWAAAIILDWGQGVGIALQLGFYVFLTVWGLARMALAKRKASRGSGDRRS